MDNLEGYLFVELTLFSSALVGIGVWRNYTQTMPSYGILLVLVECIRSIVMHNGRLLVSRTWDNNVQHCLLYQRNLPKWFRPIWHGTSWNSAVSLDLIWLISQRVSCDDRQIMHVDTPNSGTTGMYFSSLRLIHLCNTKRPWTTPRSCTVTGK